MMAITLLFLLSPASCFPTAVEAGGQKGGWLRNGSVRLGTPSLATRVVLIYLLTG